MGAVEFYDTLYLLMALDEEELPLREGGLLCYYSLIYFVFVCTVANPVVMPPNKRNI